MNEDCAPAYDDAGQNIALDSACVYRAYNDLREFVVVEQCLAAIYLVLCLRFINFLSIFFTSFRVIGRTLTLAASRLVMFTIFWAVCTFCFATVFTIYFGHVLYSYRAIEQTFMTLFRAIIGDIDFDIFNSTEWWLWGPVLVTMYAWVQVFILLTMYIAIVEDAFTAAQQKTIAKGNHKRTPFSGYTGLATAADVKTAVNYTICCRGKTSNPHKRASLPRESLAVKLERVSAIKLQARWRSVLAQRKWAKTMRHASNHDIVMKALSKNFAALRALILAQSSPIKLSEELELPEGLGLSGRMEISKISR